MPAIHLIPSLPAILVIARFRSTGEVVILANPAEGWRTILNVARPCYRITSGMSSPGSS